MQELAIKRNADLLVCFSHLRWDFVFQRPQHLMSRAAKARQVVFFEEPLEVAGAKQHLRLKRDDATGVLVATPILPGPTGAEARLLAQRKMLDILLLGVDERNLTLWYYTPMAIPFSSHLKSAACVYDNMDELSAFKNPPADLRSWENMLLSKATVVFTGGHSLYAAKRDRHHNIHAFPSSIDAAHFGIARRPCVEPEDQRDLPHPRMGFFGVIDERFNAELLGQLADLRRDWHFVMLGPVVKVDPASLPQRPNISWLGMKSYKDLPRYLSTWDVGIMPFAKNEATRYISPTKTPEFLAAGVPVVSTSIADVVSGYGDDGLVEIADSAPAFAAKCAKVLARPRRNWLRRVDARLGQESWDLTWSRMERLMAPQRQNTLKVPDQTARQSYV